MKGGKCEQKQEMILTCVRQLAPITSQAWHFPPRSGEAYIKEERIHNFKKYYLIVAVKR